MTELSKADLVWNRACSGDTAAMLSGDRAPAAMLAFHGVAMNGGVLHALEHFGSHELEGAKSGYRFFNLDGIADLLSEAKSASMTDDNVDQWEVELDRRYRTIVPDDATLVAHFEMIFRRSPAEFTTI